MINKEPKSRKLIFWALATLLFFTIYLLIRDVLKAAEEISPIIFETFCAILASVITVAAMGLMIRLQADQEKEKEFSARVFDKKIEFYTDLIETIFKLDDDNVISISELQDVENKIGSASLVASEELVSIFAQFMYQLKIYGVLYVRSMTEEQRRHFVDFVESERRKPDHDDSYLASSKIKLDVAADGHEREYFVSLDDFIQGMRDDLAVVEGNVRHNLELFVRTEFDKFKLMKRPNIVD